MKMIINFIKKLVELIYGLVVALKRDFDALFIVIPIAKKLLRYKKQNLTTSDVFLKNVKNFPNKACIIFEDKTWTFQDVNMNKLIN
jgi:hypothetical protein